MALFHSIVTDIEPMQKSTAILFLRQHQPEMAQKFDVRRLALFGSTARDEAREDSDVDILVEFTHPATLDNYCGLKRYLQSNFPAKIDLVCDDAIRAELRPYIMKDIIYVP
ncbi:MAG: nucleotidyltransferase family protein [Candidatus Symbiobacter sp.]|nr:nucleotidyltransferase family protein [Candidatus Symbiobacter sp.]